MTKCQKTFLMTIKSTRKKVSRTLNAALERWGNIFKAERPIQSLRRILPITYLAARQMDWKTAQSTENFLLFGGCLILPFRAERSFVSLTFLCWRKTM